MRYLDPKLEPDCLRQFIHTQTRAVQSEEEEGLAVIYAQFSETGLLREELAAQQGRLCGYTGQHLPAGQGHVEHIKPQHLCEEEATSAGREWGQQAEEDLAHTNMIAAVSKRLPKKKMLEERAGETPEQREERLLRDAYGAIKKDSWYRADMVKPTSPDCETRLLYLDDGRVVPADETDAGAVETIQALNLDHPELRTARRGAIRGQLPQQLLAGETDAELEDVVRSALTLSDGELTEFSFAIIQNARRYLP